MYDIVFPPCRYLQDIESDDDTESSDGEDEKSKDEKPAGSEEKIKALSISCYLNRLCIFHAVSIRGYPLNRLQDWEKCAVKQRLWEDPSPG